MIGRRLLLAALAVVAVLIVPAADSVAQQRRVAQHRSVARPAAAPNWTRVAVRTPEGGFRMGNPAARVKVRHKMRSGFVFASNKRITRFVNTVVLPDPAEASTHTDDAGSDACRWARLGSIISGVSARAAFVMHPPPCGPIPTIAQDARNHRNAKPGSAWVSPDKVYVHPQTNR